jgi:hypothetical protein
MARRPGLQLAPSVANNMMSILSTHCLPDIQIMRVPWFRTEIEEWLVKHGRSPPQLSHSIAALSGVQTCHLCTGVLSQRAELPAA